MSDPLTADELLRYNRQMLLPEVGEAGQRRLRQSRVLIVGLGGLGSPLALYLAAAGVGAIGLVDADRVDAGNIHRQIAHGTADVGRPKIESAAETVRAINPLVETTLHPVRLGPGNADELLRPYDVAAGCLDSFAARYDLDAACVRQGKPHIYGSVRGWEGQASIFAGGGPCYRCFFRDPPPRDWRPAQADQAILGSVAGIVGCIMAHETLKTVLGAKDTLSGRLLLYDGLKTRFRDIAVKRDPDCPVCGGRCRA